MGYLSPPQALIDAALLLLYPDNRDRLFDLYEAVNYPSGPYGKYLVSRVSFKVTKRVDHLNQSSNPADTSVLIGGNGDPVTTVTTTTYDTDAATYVTDAATFATALGVLVADGASPTQAHVTTANNAYTQLAADYTALAAAYTAMKAQITALSREKGDAYVSFDTTKMLTRTQLKTALDDVLTRATGSGNVTP